MLKKLAGPLLVSLVLAITGCATSESTSAMNTSGPPANANGAWSGWAGMGAAAAPVSLTLTQNGGNVTGNMSVGGSPDMSGPVVGTVQGNMLSLKMQDSGRSFSAMTVSLDRITGIISQGPVTLERSK